MPINYNNPNEPWIVVRAGISGTACLATRESRERADKLAQWFRDSDTNENSRYFVVHIDDWVK